MAFGIRRFFDHSYDLIEKVAVLVAFSTTSKHRAAIVPEQRLARRR